MSDLISREKVFDVISDWYDNESDIETLAFLISNIPTEEPRRGKWIPQFDKWGDYVTTTEGYKCSECGEFDSMKDNFCPNCGADMRGEANE